MSDPLCPTSAAHRPDPFRGGARAAYQVGVLAAIADLLPDSAGNPFPVIVGDLRRRHQRRYLACGAPQFRQAIQRLTAVWQGFRTEHVYRSDWPGVTRQASRFLGYSLLGLGRVPVALLDNRPLHELLARELDFSWIHAAVRQRQLRAVAVTAFGYESGQAVTFYQGRATIDPWVRHRRLGIPTRLELRHLLASAAIPLLFPPVRSQPRILRRRRGCVPRRPSARRCTWAPRGCW